MTEFMAHSRFINFVKPLSL